MAMSKAEADQIRVDIAGIKTDIADLRTELRTEAGNLRATLDGMKIIVPVMAATNGLLVIVGLSLVGTLIAKLFGWV